MECSRDCGEWFSIFTHYFWFRCRTVNLRRFSLFFNSMDGYGIRGFFFTYSKYGLSFLVGFIFFFVRGISVISYERPWWLPLSSLVYSFLSLLFCLHFWIMYVLWRVGFVYCIVSVGFFFFILRRSCRNNLVVKEVFRTAAQKP